MKLTKLALIEQYSIFRSGLESLFRNHAWIKVVHSTGNWDQAQGWVRSNDVHVVMIDLTNVSESLIDGIKKLKKDVPSIKIIIITMKPSESLVRRCLNIGCNGFITKSAERIEVQESVAEVMNNRIYISRNVNAQLITRMETIADKYPQNPLTGRELQVLEMVCKEYNSREISQKLKISEYTVANHRKSISRKLGARNLAGLVRYALMNGVL